MLAIVFANSWALWALPIVGAPILIHLLNRRRFVRRPWAAMTFLQRAVDQSRRRMRMESLIVLALRTLAVLLFLLAIARPSLDVSLLARADATHHIFVLDDSASMADRGWTGTLFDEAVSASARVVDELAAVGTGKDRISCRLSNGRSDAQILDIGLTPNATATFRRGLRGQKPQNAVFDPGQALLEAKRRVARSASTRNVHYHLVTDLRAHDWYATGTEKPRISWSRALDALDPTRERVTVHSVHKSARGGANLAVTSFDCQDRLATPGLPLHFEAVVHNSGNATSATSEMAFEVNGSSRVVEPVPPISPGSEMRFTWTRTFASAGDYGISVSLAPDRQPLDNDRSLVVPVLEQVQAAVVEAPRRGRHNDWGGRFVEAALSPDNRVQTGFGVTRLDSSVLADGTFLDSESRFDLIWLCDVPTESLSPYAVERLSEFVRSEGGSLVIHLGDNTRVTAWNQLHDRHPELFPAALRDTLATSERSNLSWSNTDPQLDRLWSVLRPAVDAQVEVRQWMVLSSNVEHAWLRAGGDPLLAHWRAGAGHVCLWTTELSGDERWNNLPSSFAFMPIVQELARTTARIPDTSEQTLRADQTFVRTLQRAATNGDVAVTPIGGRAKLADSGTTLTFSSEPTPDDSGLVLEVSMRELGPTGLFRFELERTDSSRQSWLVASNPIVEERFLEPADATLLEQPGITQGRVEFREHDDQAPQGERDTSADVTQVLLLALLASLFLETACCALFSRRRQQRRSKLA